MDDLTRARVYDGHGAFCAVNKKGQPDFSSPPTKRNPIVTKRNRLGVRHINKTHEDSLPVKQRRRYLEWAARIDAMQTTQS